MPGTVTVASKLPHGLRLQLQKPVKVNEPVMGGGYKEVTRHENFGDVVILNGSAVTQAHGGKHRIEGGFALTPGVDADFFTKWMAQNKDHPAVINGFIFASEKPDDVASYTEEFADELSGLEPTDPDNLPTEFKRKIQKAAA